MYQQLSAGPVLTLRALLHRIENRFAAGAKFDVFYVYVMLHLITHGKRKCRQEQYIFHNFTDPPALYTYVPVVNSEWTLHRAAPLGCPVIAKVSKFT